MCQLFQILPTPCFVLTHVFHYVFFKDYTVLQFQYIHVLNMNVLFAIWLSSVLSDVYLPYIRSIYIVVTLESVFSLKTKRTEQHYPLR